MEVMGHEEAQRQETPEGWRYLDPINQTLAEAVLFFPGVHLHEIDDYIEQLEKDNAEAGAVLRERRRAAVKAFAYLQGKGPTDLDACAFVPHIEAIATFRRENFLLDYARKKRKGDLNRTEKVVIYKKREKASNMERNILICKKYKEMKENGKRHIAITLAKEFDVEPKTIYNIWAKREEFLK